MRGFWITGITAISLVVISSAQAQQRTPRECRQEVVKLCGRDREAIRECLREKASELSATCRSELMERIQAPGATDRRSDRTSAERPDAARQELSYGSEPLQKADFWAASSGNAPLVLFVHGGGWKRGDKAMMTGSAKLNHWQQQGYAVASVNYRLVPGATVEEQAADIAAATAYFRRNAARLGIDPDRIVLVGHSAGAHLVSFVGTDPQWFAGAGLSMDDVSGIIALDGAGYDVPDQMDENARLMGDTYQQAFGTDPARQKALSPTLHAGGPNAPAFLILHVQRDDAERQSKALNAALIAAGTDSKVAGIQGRGLKGHREINQKLGEPGYAASPLVDAFLAKRFAQ
ncbi:alpha/beta hydrolase [Allopontixanthobacter sediminis]|nr:alpha/beta hydrolase [Allopontixanthobacter sediminis]